jgi:hypothetical protein
MSTPRSIPSAHDEGQTVLYRRGARPCRACPYRHVPEDISESPDDDTTGARLPMPPLARIAVFPPPRPRPELVANLPRPALLTPHEPAPDPPAHAPSPVPRRRPRAEPHARAYFLLNLALALLVLIGLVLLVARAATPPHLVEDHATRRT